MRGSYKPRRDRRSRGRRQRHTGHRGRDRRGHVDKRKDGPDSGTSTHTHTCTRVWTETQGDGDRRQQRARGAGRTVGGGCAEASGEEGGGAPLSPRPGRQGPELHDTALGLVRVRVLEPQSLLRPVFFQVGELFAVDRSTPLPGQTERGGSGGTRARPPALPQGLEAPESSGAGAGPRSQQSPSRL